MSSFHIKLPISILEDTMKEEQEIRAWALLLYTILYGKKQITDIAKNEGYKKIIKLIKDGKL